MGAHTASSNETAIIEPLELVAIAVQPFSLLSFPYLASSFRTVESTVDVGPHNFAVMLQLPSQRCTLRPRYATVRDEYVEAAIEFLDYCLDRRFNVRGVEDIDLVRLA